MTEREKKLVEALRDLELVMPLKLRPQLRQALAEFEAAEQEVESTGKCDCGLGLQGHVGKHLSGCPAEPSQDRGVAREWWAIIMPPAKGDTHSAALLYWEKPQHGAIKGLCTRIREVLDSDQPIRTFDAEADRIAMEDEAIQQNHVISTFDSPGIVKIEADPKFDAGWSAALKHYGIGGGE